MAIIKKGCILSGDYKGWSVSVDDDRNGETGGFYLFIENQCTGYDHWFVSEHDLEAQLDDFVIEWDK